MSSSSPSHARGRRRAAVRGRAEQGRPQLGDVLGPPGGLLVGGLHESSDLGAVGAVELPGDVDGALDQVELDVVARAGTCRSRRRGGAW